MIDENFSTTAGNERTGKAIRAETLESPIREDVDAIDGCDLEIVDQTSDEDLPPTEGGVA